MADPQLVPRFRNHTVIDEAATRTKGRPIFKDMEVVEIGIPGDRNTRPVFPAHDMAEWATDADGVHRPITYAEKFSDQYRQFKANQAQVLAGTPLDELPFLTEAKRSELRALRIFTAETLASLDGQNLKTLGMEGRSLKDQAAAYIATATNTAANAALIDENARLRAEVEALRGATGGPPAPSDPPAHVNSPFQEMDDEAIKEWIKDATGSRPRGNPSRDTLIRMADEANAELARKTNPQAA